MSFTTAAIRLTLAAAVLASNPALAQTQRTTGPKAVYWMTAETTSGAGAGHGSGGFNPMAMLSGGQAGRTLDLRLQGDGSAASPSAEHVIPAGLRMGASLPLLSPVGESTGETRIDFDSLPTSTTQDNGRNSKIIIYFGCGDEAGAGQPLSYRMTTEDMQRFGALAEGLRLSAVQSPAPGPGRTFGNWPNETNRREVPANGSLVGEHLVRGNYTPDIRFSLSAGQDFLAPLQLTGLGAGSNHLRWNAITGALGYFASAMGNNEAGDMVVWSSSDAAVGPMNVPDMLPASDVTRLITQKVILPASTTECRIPKAFLAAAPDAMVRLVAYGDEVNIAFPERPADRRQPWNIEYAVKVRYNSTATVFAGVDMSDIAEDGGDAGDERQSPARGLPSPSEAIGGALVRGLGGLLGRR